MAFPDWVNVDGKLGVYRKDIDVPPMGDADCYLPNTDSIHVAFMPSEPKIGDTKLKGRRVKSFPVTLNSLLPVLRGEVLTSHLLEYSDGNKVDLPEDAQIINIAPDAFNQRVLLLVESASFDLVEHGCEIPRHEKPVSVSFYTLNVQQLLADQTELRWLKEKLAAPQIWKYNGGDQASKEAVTDACLRYSDAVNILVPAASPPSLPPGFLSRPWRMQSVMDGQGVETVDYSDCRPLENETHKEADAKDIDGDACQCDKCVGPCLACRANSLAPTAQDQTSTWRDRSPML